MNHVNFLPQSFLDRQRRHVRIVREWIIVGGMLLGCVAWSIGQHGEVGAIEHQIAQKKEQCLAAEQRSVEVARLEVGRNALRQKVNLQRLLIRPIQTSSVIAAMTQLLPDSLVLTELTVTAQTPEPRRPIKVKQPATSGSAKLAKPVPPKPQFMHIVMIGMSPSDVQVANLVGRLSAYDLFTNVKMKYSRSEQWNNVHARRFCLEMDVSLDCRYLPKAAKPQELADAH